MDGSGCCTNIACHCILISIELFLFDWRFNILCLCSTSTYISSQKKKIRCLFLCVFSGIFYWHYSILSDVCDKTAGMFHVLFVRIIWKHILFIERKNEINVAMSYCGVLQNMGQWKGFLCFGWKLNLLGKKLQANPYNGLYAFRQCYQKFFDKRASQKIVVFNKMC